MAVWPWEHLSGGLIKRVWRMWGGKNDSRKKLTCTLFYLQSTLGLVEKLVTRKLSTKLKESTKLKVPIFGYKAKCVCIWPRFTLKPIEKQRLSTVIEWLVTFGTGYWLLSCVGPFMLFQMTTFCESLLTLWTSKWLFSCVDSFMVLQMTPHCKWLVTFGTSKGLLSCVSCVFKWTSDWKPCHTLSK